MQRIADPPGLDRPLSRPCSPSSSAGCSASSSCTSSARRWPSRARGCSRRRRAPATRRGPALDPPAVLDGWRRRPGRGARRAARARRSPAFELDRTRRREPHGPHGRGPARRRRRGRAPATGSRPTGAGVLTIGPLTAVRHDVLGLARSIAEVAGIDEVLVVAAGAPARDAVARPGRARPPPPGARPRLGPGDFHSLRDYVDGDEPRTIHWRASARSKSSRSARTASKACAAASSCSTSTLRRATPATRVRAGGHRGGQHRPQRRPGRAHDPFRDQRRGRPARARRRRPDAAPAGPGHAERRATVPASSAIPAKGSARRRHHARPGRRGLGALERRRSDADVIGVFTMTLPARAVVLAVDARPRRRSSTGGTRWPAAHGDRARAKRLRRSGPMSDHAADRPRWRSTSPPPAAWRSTRFVAALGFARVFGDWEFIPDVAGRRRRRPRRCRSCCAACTCPVSPPSRSPPSPSSGRRLAVLPGDVRRLPPDGRDVGRRLGRPRPRARPVPDAVAPVAYVGGWAMLAAIGTAFASCVGHVRLPRPRPRRGARARRACCSCSSPRSAPTASGSG